jgi:hypothetical protein
LPHTRPFIVRECGKKLKPAKRKAFAKEENIDGLIIRPTKKVQSSPVIDQ